METKTSENRKIDEILEKNLIINENDELCKILTFEKDGSSAKISYENISDDFIEGKERTLEIKYLLGEVVSITKISYVPKIDTSQSLKITEIKPVHIAI